MQNKLAHLRDEVFQGTSPSDAEIAAEGNRKAGRNVLTDALVEGLRRGTDGAASDNVLDVLALALDVPPIFFRTRDPRLRR